jgi:hypothetical protein
MRWLALIVLVACGPTTAPVDDPRGEANGRMFDFVSTKPNGDQWTIRVRGDSLWAAFSTSKDDKEYDPKTLAPKEAKKLWKLIDRLDLPDREPGKPDPDGGSVLLRLREPSGNGDDEDSEALKHDLIASYVSRDTDDDDVIDLANYLIDLVQAHDGVEPAF